jgi:hypothetical protein
VYHLLFLVSFIKYISSNNIDKTFSTSSFDNNFLTLSFIFVKVVLKLIFHLCVNKIDIFHDSSGLKLIISLSFSTINLTATDCTLPADNHFLIFFQSTGLTLYQTNLSNNLLACCASTNHIFIVLGFSIANIIAFLVIS